LELRVRRNRSVETYDAAVQHQARSGTAGFDRGTVCTWAVLSIELEQGRRATARVERRLCARRRDRPAIARQVACVAGAPVRPDALEERACQIHRSRGAE